MDCKVKFFSNETGCNIIEVISCDKQGQYTCCGEALKELIPNTSEGAAEKHIPVVEQNGSNIKVSIGSVFHPMTEEHNITWVYLETIKGGQRINLQSKDEPIAHFVLADGDKAIAAYAYCNLHGFWKAEL